MTETYFINGAFYWGIWPPRIAVNPTARSSVKAGGQRGPKAMFSVPKRNEFATSGGRAIWHVTM
jgi:hypothetical protein